jgi:hypothetical protein
MSKNKTKKNPGAKRVKKLNLGDVVEIFGVRYRIKRLILIDGSANTVSVTAQDLSTPTNVCFRHRKELEVLFVLNKDRRIPVFKK